MSRLTVKDAVSGKDINNLLEANNENQTGAADAYMLAIGGKTYSQYKKERKEREERRKEYDRWEEEYKAKIPALTKIWIDEGYKVLSEDKWQMWNECVPIRLGDLYKGIELGQCLDIIRTVKEHTNKNTEAIVKYIDGHFEEKVLSGVEFDAFVESLFLLYDMDFTNDSVVSRILPYEENRNVKVTLYNLAKVTLYNLTWVYGKSSNALAKAITIRKLWEEHE